MAGQKRIKTEDRNIYYNTSTKRYDIKYNYKTYNAEKQKNDYKAKWKYGLLTLDEARTELALLKRRNSRGSEENREITLQESYELWKNKAKAQNYSKATMLNASYYVKMLGELIPLNTRIDDITEEMYEDVFARCREKYKDETINTLNATFRKLINLTYRKRLISEHPLARADNVKAGKTDRIRIVTREEWNKIDGYLDGVYSRDRNFRFMLNILYYTGIRIGECMALTWADFEVLVPYQKHGAGEKSGMCGQEGDAACSAAAESDGIGKESDGTRNRKHERMRLNISKTILRDGTPKDTTKNKKNRKIPLSPAVVGLYKDGFQVWEGSRADRIFTDTYDTYIGRLASVCRKLEIPHCTCHSFRHTFISNLMRKGVPLPVIEKVSGDTQKTIFDRYSHMFDDDEDLVLKALENL